MGITPAMAIGGLGAAGSLMGMFGGSSAGNVQLPRMQQTDIGPGQGQAQGAIGGLGQYNIGAQFAPNVAGIANAYMANPYASGFQQNAGAFSGMGINNAYGGLGNAALFGGQTGSDISAANTVFGTMAPQIGMAGAVANMGFDPQSALYNRTAQQVSDQSLAALSNSGVATTPWGQGVQGNTMSNFNIDWQNQQLQRAIAGAGAAGSLYGGAGAAGATGAGLLGSGLNLGTGAFNLGQGAAGSGVAMGGVPMDAYNQILSNQMGGLNAAAGYGNTIGQLPGMQAGDWLSYMGGVNQSNQVANQVGNMGLQQQQQGFQQNQTFGKDLGGSLAMMTGAVTPAQMFGGQLKPQQPGSYGYFG